MRSWCARWLMILGACVITMLVAGFRGPATTRAQDGCAQEQEPNDDLAAVSFQTGDTCITGTLDGADQDLFGWEVTAADATSRWTLTLSGVQDAVTGLDVLPVTSEPGVEPPTVSSTSLVRIQGAPDAPDAQRANVLLPVGRYVLGLSRSAAAGAMDSPSIDYRFSISRGQPLPPIGDVEPNDDAATGIPIAGPFELGGDISGTPDVFRWSAPGDATSGPWDLVLQVPVGTATRLTATASDGTRFTSVTADQGLATIHDLTPDPAGYTVVLDQPATAPTPYILRAVEGAPSPDRDAEPNDRLDWALPMGPGQLRATGRLPRRRRRRLAPDGGRRDVGT
jgi:hypothetical protein